MQSSQIIELETFRRDAFLISSESERINVDMVHQFLAYESYWAKGIAKQTVERFIRHSLCYGVYDCAGQDEEQIGFARVITDYSRFAYLSDLFILPSYRDQGLGKWLVSCILAHSELQGVRKWMLHTKDAHSLYERYGFQLNPDPDTFLAYRPQQKEATVTE